MGDDCPNLCRVCNTEPCRGVRGHGGACCCSNVCADNGADELTAPAKRPRKSQLNGAQLMRLNDACIRVRESLGQYGTYLVGSSTDRADYRDVDVRHIMADDTFDALFAGRELFWSLVCMSVSIYLTQASGLPIDFQIQRMTEANEKYGDLGEHPRHPLGMKARPYAGGGHATKFDVPGQGQGEADA